jgi:hypothetical protein
MSDRALQAIINRTAREFNVDPIQLMGRRRHQEIALPRHVAMYLAHKMTRETATSIGKAFNRDHTTVLHAIGKVEMLIAGDEDLDFAVAAIRRDIPSQMGARLALIDTIVLTTNRLREKLCAMAWENPEGVLTALSAIVETEE